MVFRVENLGHVGSGMPALKNTSAASAKHTWVMLAWRGCRRSQKRTHIDVAGCRQDAGKLGALAEGEGDEADRQKVQAVAGVDAELAYRVRLHSRQT